MVGKALFSSARQDWETPQYLFDFLNKRYKFELDPCANEDNYKCDLYFTEKENGIKREWTIVESAFMNPPYGNSEQPCKTKCEKKKCQIRGHHITKYIPGVSDWVGKAYSEATLGMLVVCLIAARTDTKWWHKYCMNATEIWFIEGRLHFTNKTISDYTGKSKTSPATFPSSIVIFDGRGGDLPTKPQFRSLHVNNKTKEVKLI